MHMPFRKPYATIFTGFHSRSITFYILFSRVKSTRCHNFSSLACLPRLRVCHGFLAKTHKTLLSKTHAKLLRMTFLSTALAGSVATTLAGARSHFQSFLIPVPLMARYASILQCRLLPGTTWLLLAAGAITFKSKYILLLKE
jgi:hypothetical protein